MQISVLYHANDPNANRRLHLIHYLAEYWRQQAHEVEFYQGLESIDRALEADLIIPHVDLTRTTEDYRSCFDRHPRVVNRRVIDISKRKISRLQVTRGDGYDGPVIVKTDENFGGMRDARLRGGLTGKLGQQRTRLGRWIRSLERRWVARRSRRLGRATRLVSSTYPVFERASQVPAEAHDNPALIVEQFIPEMEAGRYYVRCYLFVGDRSICGRYGSDHAIVKSRNVTSAERVAVHPQIEALRHELGFDYGKFDYVERAGEAVLLDANRTPGQPGAERESVENAAELGPGLDVLMDSVHSRA